MKGPGFGSLDYIGDGPEPPDVLDCVCPPDKPCCGCEGIEELCGCPEGGL